MSVHNSMRQFDRTRALDSVDLGVNGFCGAARFLGEKRLVENILVICSHALDNAIHFKLGFGGNFKIFEFSWDEQRRSYKLEYIDTAGIKV